jgi:alpha-tubulin suppressor-like RCC1 family protein
MADIRSDHVIPVEDLEKLKAQLTIEITEEVKRSINLEAITGGPADVPEKQFITIVNGQHIPTVFFTTNKGKVYSCGCNHYGVLGRTGATTSNNTTNLGQITALPKIRFIRGTKHIAQSVGYGSVYFLSEDNEVFNCGLNNTGQLGRRVANVSDPNTNLSKLSLQDEIADVKICHGIAYSLKDTTFESTFLISKYGKVYSCGENNVGQLGTLTKTGNNSYCNLLQIYNLPSIKKMYLPEWYFTGSDLSQYNYYGPPVFFLTHSGNVYSCGSNLNGELARTIDTGSPTLVNLNCNYELPPIDDMAQMSYLYSYTNTTEKLRINPSLTLFKTTTNEIYGAGYNRTGLLGITASVYPLAYLTDLSQTTNLDKIPTLSNIKSIYISCLGCSNSDYPFGAVFYLTHSGDIWSCGRNSYGETGKKESDGSYNAPNLSKISGLSSVKEVVVGNAYHLNQSAGTNWFLTTSGAVYVCGVNNVGQMGISHTNVAGSTESSLTRITALPSIKKIAIPKCKDYNNMYAYFLTTNGDVYSCGNNQYGQLGRNVATGTETTVNLGKISGLPKIDDIVTYHTPYEHDFVFFITSTGSVYSCGYNAQGQCGRDVANGSATATNLGVIPGLNLYD